MVAFHGVPVCCESMLIGIALMFFHQKGAFNAPPIAGTEVTTGMEVEPVKGTTGNPGMFGFFGNDLFAVRVNFLPLESK